MRQDAERNGGQTKPRKRFGENGVAYGRWLMVPILALAIALITPRAAQTDDGAHFFETEVRPILQKRCFTCHDGADGSGGLNLNDRAALLKGGATGPAVSLTKPEDSLLLHLISYTETRKMPPQGKIPDGEIAVLRRWVRMGLPFSTAKSTAKPKAGSAATPTFHGPPPVNAETKRFWSFVPVKRPAVPPVQNTAWVRNPVDAFVLAKLEANGLHPARPADRVALLRRVTYDLTGLPPTPHAVRAFVQDKSPNAYAKVVDKLLASPQYGERWGRHWLDLVRYAETNSFERDGDKPFVWRYRDYVIRSLNSDKPYNQFIREQLAGDELPIVTPETITATGFYRLGQWDDEPADPEQARYDELDDIVGTTGQTFLGLTVNCARCHDHKLDPIPQRDYYKMLAFFQGVRRYGQRSNESVEVASLRVIASADEQKENAAAIAAYRAQLKPVQARMDAIEKPVFADLSPVEKEEWRDEMKRPALIGRHTGKLPLATEANEYQQLMDTRRNLRDHPPAALARALSVTEEAAITPTHVLLRGNPHAPGDTVEPGFLSVLSPPAPVITSRPAVAGAAPTSGRRLALANWIASEKNPLTARVLVNRVFQYHFGRGIVRSSSNFGRLGIAPTHPELLNYLASEFVRMGWRLKPLHRLLVLSNAYQMSSRPDKVALRKDPENDLLWRFDMRRLEAEEIRDSLLAVNGTLNPKMYGPSITPPIPAEVLAGQSMPGSGWGLVSPDEAARRSVYVKIKRSLALPLLAAHDAAETDFTCPVRFATTQPTQALTFLNSTFLNEQASLFAERLRHDAGNDVVAQVKLGLWRTCQRPPTVAEIQRGVRYLREAVQEPGVDQKQALHRYCLLLLNLNEFVYLD